MNNYKDRSALRVGGLYPKRGIVLNCISALMGVFVTAPIITLKFTGKHISVFSILFMVFFVFAAIDTILTTRRLKIRRYSKLLAMWFYLSIVSSLYGLLVFNDMPDFTSNIIHYANKIILYLILLIVISTSRRNSETALFFLKGFFVGCMVNVAWGIVEGVFFHLFGYSLSNLIFHDYITTLSANRQFVTIIKDTGIRVSGLNYDPAHLGCIVPILASYFFINKQFYFLIPLTVVVIFSQSTTALVSSVILILFIMATTDSHVLVKILKKAFYCTGYCCVLVLFLGLIYGNTEVLQGLKKNLTNFVERSTSNYIYNGEKSIRTLYHLYVPSAMLYKGLGSIIGTGFGTASYSYVASPEISHAIGLNTLSAFDPESVYVSYLFDVGVIGLAIYMILLYKNIKYYSKVRYSRTNSLIFSALGGIAVSGLFYHYTLTSYQVIILIISTVLMDENHACTKTIFQDHTSDFWYEKHLDS